MGDADASGEEGLGGCTMNWFGVVLFVVALSTIPATILFIHYLDRMDTKRSRQIDAWIRSYDAPSEEN